MKLLNTVLKRTFLIAVVASVIPSIQTASAQSNEKHRYIVGFKEAAVTSAVGRTKSLAGLSREVAARFYKTQVLRNYGLTTKLDLGSGGAVVVEATDTQANSMASSLVQGNNPGSVVAYIEPDAPLMAFRSPNDPYMTSGALWGLNGGVANIGATRAWDITTGSQDVVVGVIDTGIDYNHGDLVNNMWRNPSEIAGNGLDDDSNGIVDDVYGVDFANFDADPMDDHYHGTHVAGTIGAQGDNGTGVSGVNWSVKLMGLKFLGANGSGYTSGAILAINYAILLRQRGVNIRVLNASFGGGSYSQSFYDALVRANEAGILFVAAAGNSKYDNDSAQVYPANYDVPNVISVAAVTSSGALASYSNYGASKVHLGAPGSSILSTYPVRLGSYAALSGTSMAAPHVSGVAALMLGQNSALLPASIKATMIETAQPLTSLSAKTVAGGMVDAYAAVLSVTTSQTVNVGGTITSDGVPIAGVSVVGPDGATTSTDGSGYYVFTQVAKGANYTVSPTKTGYMFSPESISATASADAIHDFTANLNSYSIGGIVSVDGVGLAGANVDGGALGSVTTESDGSYLFTGVLHGTSFTLNVSRTGYLMSPGSISAVCLGNTRANFSAALTTHTISGRLTIDGQAIAGVVVNGGALGQVVSDENGNYSFVNVPFDSTFVITPVQTGRVFSPLFASGVVTGDVNHNFSAQMASYHALGGIVSFGKKALRNATVSLSYSGLSFYAVTDKRGRYQFSNVPAGVTYSLRPSLAGYMFSEVSGFIVGDLNQRHDAAVASYAITGVVKGDGVPLSGVLVRAGKYGAAVTGSDGVFRIEGLPHQAKVTVSVKKLGFKFRSAKVRISGDTFIELHGLGRSGRR